MSEESKIAIVVEPAGKGLWRVYLEGHPKAEFNVPSEMPDSRSFAPGTRVVLRVVIPGQKHAITDIAPPPGPSVAVTVTFGNKGNEK